MNYVELLGNKIKKSGVGHDSPWGETNYGTEKKTKSANFIATPIQRQHEIIGPSEK